MMKCSVVTVSQKVPYRHWRGTKGRRPRLPQVGTVADPTLFCDTGVFVVGGVANIMEEVRG